MCLKKIEKECHVNWIPIYNTKLRLGKNSVLQMEIVTWEREKRVLDGVPLSEANGRNREFFTKLQYLDLGRIFSNKVLLPLSFLRDQLLFKKNLSLFSWEKLVSYFPSPPLVFFLFWTVLVTSFR